MAIQFVKTSGDGLTFPTSTIGTRLNGAASASMHAWVWHTTDDAGDSANNGACMRMAINGATTGIFMNLDSGGGGTNRKHQVGGRATGADALSSKEMTTNLNLGQWNSLGGVWNYGANTLAPWMNGVTENGGAASFGAGTYTNGTPTDLDRISNSNGGTVQAVDGKICECAIWKVALTNGEMIALSKGFSALLIRPQSLIFYAPLWGRATNEPDLVRTTTITKVNTSGNIIRVDHPAIIYPSPQEIRAFGGAGGGGPAYVGNRFFLGF